MKETKNPGSIYGNVVSNGEAMAYASVSLFKEKDSSLVSGIITDDRGEI